MKDFKIPERFKNIYFWFALVSAVLTALQWDLSMFTSWDIVFEKAKELLGNPYMIATTVFTIVGVIMNPTTKGITDKE